MKQQKIAWFSSVSIGAIFVWKLSFTKYDYVIPSNKKLDKLWVIHKVLFGDAEYRGHYFYVSYEKHHQNHEKQKIYISKSHMYIYDLHQHQKTLLYDSWFQKNDYVKYLHDIFTKCTKITNWKHEKHKVTFTSSFLVIQCQSASESVWWIDKTRE